MQTTHKSHKFNVHVQQRIRTSYHIVPCLQEGFRILATLPLYGKNYSNSKSAKQNPSCIITMVIITAVTTESSLWTSKIQEQLIYCPSWTIFFPRLLRLTITNDTSWLPLSDLDSGINQNPWSKELHQLHSSAIWCPIASTEYIYYVLASTFIRWACLSCMTTFLTSSNHYIK